MKIIRKILKGLSLTAALFVFQACYGTPQAGNSGYTEEEETTKVAEVPSDEEVDEEAVQEEENTDIKQ